MAENEPVGGLTQANRRQLLEGYERDFPAQLRQAQETVRQSLEQGRAANSALMEFLNSQRGTGPSPLLQLASGLLRPTRAGGFGESLAAGAEGYAGALQQQRQSELDRAMRIQQLQAATANLGLQAAERTMALTNQGLQFPAALAASRGALGDLEYYEAAEAARMPATAGQRTVATGAAAAPGMPAPASPVGPQQQIIQAPLPAPAVAVPAAPPPAAAPATAPAAPLDLDEGVNTETMGPPGTQEMSEGDRRVEETLARLASEQRERLQAERAAATAAAAAAPTPAPATAPAPAPATAPAPAPAAAPAPAPAAATGARPAATAPGGTVPGPAGIQVPRAVLQDPRYQQAVRDRELALANPRSAAARAIITNTERVIDRLIDDYNKSPEGRAEIVRAEEEAKAAVRRERLLDIENEEFGTTAARTRAQDFAEHVKGASEGRQMLSRLSVLENVTGDLPSGILAWFSRQGAALNLGPQATQYQVATALLEQLIPGQRQGMPGAVSDRDVEMFRRSLPSLMASPDGRQMVIDTLKSVSEDQVARGRIARDALNRRITAEEAENRMDALPSPFARFLEYQEQAGRNAAGRPAQPGGAGARSAPQSNIPPPPPGISPREWGAMRPEDRALWRN